MVYEFKNSHIPFGDIEYYVEDPKLKEIGIDRVIIQKEYAKKPQKTEIYKLIDKVQPGDIVITSSLVNFSRAYISMVEKLNAFLEKDVRVIAYKEHYDSDKYKDKPWLTQYEWQKKYDENRNIVLRANQAKGIEKAKQEGKFKGHNNARYQDFKDFTDLYAKLKAHEITKIKMATELGVSRPTLDRLIKDYVLYETMKKEVGDLSRDE